MAKYRKLPVIIEAVEFAPGMNDEELLPFLDGCIGWHMDNDGNLAIPTLEGIMTAKPGDYIIKGIHGEFYPCKPDIFEKTYELWEYKEDPK